VLHCHRSFSLILALLVLTGANQGGEPSKKGARVDRHGDPLPASALMRMGTLRLRQGGAIDALAVSPNGKLIASGGWNPVIRLWDAATGKEVRQLGNLGQGVDCLVFTPNGKTLVSAGRDETVRLWEVATGKEIHRLPKGGTVAALSADGKLLATGGWDKTIHLWDVPSGRKLRSFPVPHRGISSLAFSPKGRLLVSGGAYDDGTIRLWDVASGKEVRQFAGKRSDVRILRFSPDGATLVSGGNSQAVQLWDVATGNAVRQFGDQELFLSAVAFSPDGRTLATGAKDHTLCLWEVATGKIRRRLAGHTDRAYVLAFAPDGKTLVSGGEDRVVRVWDLRTGKEQRPAEGHQHRILSLAWSAGKIATTSADHTLRLWDAATGKELRAWHEPGGWEGEVAFSPDGKTLAAVRSGSYVVLLDVGTGKEVRRFPRYASRVRSLAFSPLGDLLAVGGSDLTIRLWETATGKEVCRLSDSKRPVDCVRFSPDGRTLASGHSLNNLLRSDIRFNDERIYCWDVATGKKRCTIQGHWLEVTALAFSPDGKTLAVAGSHGPVSLWEVATGQERCKIETPPNWTTGNAFYLEDLVRRLSFSPDGNLLAIAGPDNQIHFTDLATGKIRARFGPHQGRVFALAFARDGKTLASAANDTTVLTWDVSALGKRKLPEVQLSPKDLEALWETLRGDTVHAAIWQLIAAPKQSVPFLQRRLTPMLSVEPQQLARWIAELDDNRFATRKEATAKLERLGELAGPALKQALKSPPSAEARKRVEVLLQKLAVRDTSPEFLRQLRGIEVLEQIGSPAARKVLQALAAGAQDAWLTWEAKASLQRSAIQP
jgi:WD40 repeat protein